MYFMCGGICVSVCHVLWEYPAYEGIRDQFVESLKDTIRDR